MRSQPRWKGGPRDIAGKIFEIRRYRPEAKIRSEGRAYLLAKDTVDFFPSCRNCSDSQLKSRIVQVSFGLLSPILVNGF